VKWDKVTNNEVNHQNIIYRLDGGIKAALVSETGRIPKTWEELEQFCTPIPHPQSLLLDDSYIFITIDAAGIRSSYLVLMQQFDQKRTCKILNGASQLIPKLFLLS
jgi:hypothetical protein